MSGVERCASRVRRSPHGERGLKSRLAGPFMDAVGSLPSRGAWIEIIHFRREQKSFTRRSPHGERGLKFAVKIQELIRMSSRSPHGERGLK